MPKQPDSIRLGVLSDIHLDMSASEPLDLDELAGRADLLVAAGNIAYGSLGLAWCSKAPLPCVYVLGNREFFSLSYVGTRGKVAMLAPNYPDVHVLDDTAVELAIRGIKVRFIGGTLWTDYMLYGKGRRAAGMLAAEYRLEDHRRILHGDSFWMPQDAAAAHARTKAFLAAELEKPFDGLTVVVTHHAPTPRAVNPEQDGDGLNPASFSNLEALMPRANAWIFGHTHYNVDFNIGKCRVISNQRGFPGENPDFAPRIIEIPVA
jgi:predicted phosphodiesterase